MKRRDDHKVEQEKHREKKSSPAKPEAEASPEKAPDHPPRTTTRGWFTSPKFGFATSGGGEIEPGPEED